jgi:hypothetical protein
MLSLRRIENEPLPETELSCRDASSGRALDVEHEHSPRFDSLDFKFVRPEKSSAAIRPSRLSTRPARDDLA